MCDTLAKQVVGRGLTYSAVLSPLPALSLPFKQAAILVDHQKLTSDVSEPIQYHLGFLEASCFYTQPTNILDNRVNNGSLGWSVEHFEKVDWDSLHAALLGQTRYVLHVVV